MIQPASSIALWGDTVPDDRGQAAHTESSGSPWIVVVFFLVLLVIATRIQEEWATAQVAHHRRALLLAYRRRRQWRKADVPRLLKLGVGTPAMMRINRIMAGKSRGRGVVQGYQPLDEAVTTWAARLGLMFAPGTAPYMRIAILKQTPWWPHIVEALYRGEYAAAKRGRQKSPSASAEQSVASCLGISDASVHKICESVRRGRKQKHDPMEWEPPLSVSDFEVWKRQGGDLGGPD